MRTIEFANGEVDKIVAGVKTATSRTHRYGRVGDLLRIAGGYVRLTSVTDEALSDAADAHFAAEGFATREALVKEWVRLHPRSGFVAYQRVYHHVFAYLPACPEDVKG